MADLEKLKKAILSESLEGWLFCGFRHRDEIADRILGIPKTRTNTRPWYCVIYPDSPPVLILHTLEPRILDPLEGERFIYSSREELKNILQELKPGRLAAQYSKELPVVSFLDHGTASLFIEAGFTLVESKNLIQKTLGILSEEDFESHERAACHLYDIVEKVWDKLCRFHRDHRQVSEGNIQNWILEEFEARNLYTAHPPIVAQGEHSADPHYSPDGPGAVIEPGRVLQLDLWAKEKSEAAIYADISWVGVCKREASQEEKSLFCAVRDARNRVTEYIQEELSAGRFPLGKDADIAARNFLEKAGYGFLLKHRTGHGIDREVHGFGANLDSVEFPDSRALIPGSCFSIEPGAYGKDFGMRTEINGYIRNRTLHISGKTPQRELLTF